MTQRDKLIAKMRARPVQADIEDVEKVLELFGWQRQRQKGSHVSYGSPGITEIFTVSVHNGRVKQVYVKKLCALLGLDE
jgi:predicted RNA binding protein YcfA (HicA-like mRNA interferase family)